MRDMESTNSSLHWNGSVGCLVDDVAGGRGPHENGSTGGSGSDQKRLSRRCHGTIQ